MPAPAPILVRIAIEPHDEGDRSALLRTLADLAAADPTCEIAADTEAGQILLSGTSEEHVDALRTAVRGLVGGLHFGALQVACRETIVRRAEVEATHRKRAGAPTGEFARVKIAFMPAPGCASCRSHQKVFPQTSSLRSRWGLRSRGAPEFLPASP